jgi:hypothetical protein
MASKSDLNKGTKVRWSGDTYGRISKVQTSGTVSSSGHDGEGMEMEGTTEKPAYKISNYEYSDGSWGLSGVKTVHRGGSLTPIDDWPER